VGNDIVEKLKPIILQSVETEERVVYIMVEIRKLLERAQVREGELATLRFFCNWAVHTKLTRGEGSALVQLMNDLFDARLKGQLMSEEQHERLYGAFSFDRFREELLDFLRSQGLPLSNFEVLPDWVKFIKLYTAVVSDCPIIYTKTDLPLRMDRAILTTCQVEVEYVQRLRQENRFYECPFGVRWTFFKGEAQVMKWEIPIICEDYDKKHDPGRHDPS
jgi:hypothetical protein